MAALRWAQGRMPAETLNAVELKAHFQKMGFSAQELVAISGEGSRPWECEQSFGGDSQR
jgi:hypothetical protein